MSAPDRDAVRCVEPTCDTVPTHAVFVDEVKVYACPEHVEGTPSKLLQQGRIGEWSHVAVVSLGIETIQATNEMLSAGEVQRRFEGTGHDG